MVAPAWRRRWTESVPFLSFPPEVPRAIYTTNALESPDTSRIWHQQYQLAPVPCLDSKRLAMYTPNCSADGPP
jgi:transposase-like protein